MYHKYIFENKIINLKIGNANTNNIVGISEIFLSEIRDANV